MTNSTLLWKSDKWGMEKMHLIGDGFLTKQLPIRPNLALIDRIGCAGQLVAQRPKMGSKFVFLFPLEITKKYQKN